MGAMLEGLLMGVGMGVFFVGLLMISVIVTEHLAGGSHEDRDGR